MINFLIAIIKAYYNISNKSFNEGIWECSECSLIISSGLIIIKKWTESNFHTDSVHASYLRLVLLEPFYINLYFPIRVMLVQRHSDRNLKSTYH